MQWLQKAEWLQGLIVARWLAGMGVRQIAQSGSRLEGVRGGVRGGEGMRGGGFAGLMVKSGCVGVGKSGGVGYSRI